MITLEQIKDWLKSQLSCKIAVGGIDGSQEKYVGVYDGKTAPPHHIALGGQDNTKTAQKNVTILVHWTKSAVSAEGEANRIYNILFGLSNVDMSGTHVYAVIPSCPTQAGRDDAGICEYVINATFVAER